MSNNKDIRTLRCLIQGDSCVFNVEITANKEISGVKETIKHKRKRGILKDIDPDDLELWQPVSAPGH